MVKYVITLLEIIQNTFMNIFQRVYTNVAHSPKWNPAIKLFPRFGYKTNKKLFGNTRFN